MFHNVATPLGVLWLGRVIAEPAVRRRAGRRERRLILPERGEEKRTEGGSGREGRVKMSGYRQIQACGTGRGWREVREHSMETEKG